MTRSHGRAFGEPLAVKVPEITLLFWVLMPLTAMAGAATSNYLLPGSRATGAAAEAALLLVGLAWQFRVRRYRPAAYWLLAYAAAVAGTGASDTVHLALGLPYGAVAALWAMILAGLLAAWRRSEGTLSVDSVLTRRREAFYWAAVLTVFALGAALSDFTARTLGMGYLSSAGLLYAGVLVPGVGWALGFNPVAAFWWACTLTGPLGASGADYAGAVRPLGGLGLGYGVTAVAATVCVAVGVSFLAVTRRGTGPPAGSARPALTTLGGCSGRRPGRDSRAAAAAVARR